MTNEATRTGANPAEAKAAEDGLSHIEQLAADLDGIHALLREAVRVASNREDYYFQQRMEATAMAARILKACSGAHFVLARLRNEVPESRHRLIVEHARPVQDTGISEAATSATPTKISKTTSEPKER